MLDEVGVTGIWFTCDMECFQVRLVLQEFGLPVTCLLLENLVPNTYHIIEFKVYVGCQNYNGPTLCSLTKQQFIYFSRSTDVLRRVPSYPPIEYEFGA